MSIITTYQYLHAWTVEDFNILFNVHERSTPDSWNSRSMCKDRRNLRSIQFNRWWKLWLPDRYSCLSVENVHWQNDVAVRGSKMDKPMCWSDQRWRGNTSVFVFRFKSPMIFIGMNVVDWRSMFLPLPNESIPFSCWIGPESERWVIHRSIADIKSLITSRQKRIR